MRIWRPLKLTQIPSFQDKQYLLLIFIIDISNFHINLNVATFTASVNLPPLSVDELDIESNKILSEMKCKNKTASCNDETCPFDEMFGIKEDPPSQE